MISKHTKPDLDQIMYGQLKNVAVIYELFETTRHQNGLVEEVNERLKAEEGKLGPLDEN